MNNTTETSLWRDIVNESPEEEQAYNNLSLADYIDLARDYHQDLMNQIDPENIEDVARTLDEVNELISHYQKLFGDINEIHVQGNGIYMPNESEYFLFLEGSRGISGEFQGFSVNYMPSYQDLLYKRVDEHAIKPTLCVELGELRVYTSSGIALEPTGESVSIPVEGQDLCFMRTPSY